VYTVPWQWYHTFHPCYSTLLCSNAFLFFLASRHVVEVLCSRLASTAKLFLVGFSLGANTLVKYLGETGLAGHDKLPKNVAGAVSLCNPMRINHARLESPWSQILTLGAKKHFFQHRRSVNQMTCDNYQKAIQHATLYSKNLAEMAESAKPYMIRNSIRYPFENSLGYQSKEEYWNEASSQNYIAHISVPILVCFAGDDKIACQNTLAIMNSCLSNPNVILVQTPCGGHIGWHTSTHGNFVDRTAVKFISAVLRREHWDMVAESRMEAARRSRNLANGLQSKL
jgi:predicted alpha/beta-fold hydrolase